MTIVDAREIGLGTELDAEPVIPFPLSRRGDAVPAECTWLREKHPVAKVRTMTGDSAWLVSSHALARRVLEDQRFSLKDTASPGVPRQYALTIPPEVVNSMGNIRSAGLRSTVMKALSPRSHGGMEDWLRRQAHALIDEIVREGPPSDMRDGYADPLTAALMCKVIGVPFTDWRRLMSGLDTNFATCPYPFEGATAGFRKSHAYMRSQLNAGPARRSGLLGALAELRETERGDDLTDDVLATVALSMFGAGAVSTSAFLVHAVLALVRHPELFRRLREQPDAMGRAVDELLRYNLSIGDGLPRIALEDVQLGDVTVRAGELVLVLVEGANFDPDVFPDPERLDIDRDASAHLSLGAGNHYCPATSLARMHSEVALAALVERFAELRLAVPLDQLVWRTGFVKRLPERLPVVW